MSVYLQCSKGGGDSGNFSGSLVEAYDADNINGKKTDFSFIQSSFLQNV